MNKTTRWMVLAALLSLVLPTLAADPPGLMNYQGVLRDDNDVPLDGSHDMIFRFYDDADPAPPENEIFVDEHLAAGTGAVTVTGGLFDVLLGSGNAYDGAGAGDHPNLHYVFALHEAVHLEVQVGSETLQPRMRVVAAPYAMNAMNSVLLGGREAIEYITTGDEVQEKTGLFRPLGGVDFGDGDHDDLTANDVTHLTSGPATYADFLHQHAYADNADTVDGKHANEFIDTSPTFQTKNGMLKVDSSSQPTSTAIEAWGGERGGYFSTTAYSGYAWLGTFDFGIRAGGSSAGGEFVNSTYGSSASLADISYGIDARGPEAGGYFSDDTQESLARAGYKDPVSGDTYGVWAEGESAGGHFRNSAASSETGVWLGHHNTIIDKYVGILARGEDLGGVFTTTDPGIFSVAELASGGFAVTGVGDDAGGYFIDNNDSGYAFVGYLDEGISAHGDVQGGYFEDNDGTSDAHIAYGDHGIEAGGDTAGGLFILKNTPTQAAVAWRDPAGEEYGVYGRGATAGGSFHSNLGSGEADLAIGDIGVEGSGDFAGGHFSDSSASGEAYLGVEHSGIDAAGDARGAFFFDSNSSGWAYVGSGDKGIEAYGTQSGGYFVDSDSSGYAWVGANDYGITAYGDFAGGYFGDGDHTGNAFVGYGNQGVWGAGSFAGATFSDTIPHTNVFADVARTVVVDPGPPAIEEFYKILGNGTNAFVQNHPEDPDKVVVYASPEGDEVATYTRGTARLVAGEVRISLGTTFRWVTNPDVGLTAYLTPHGDCLGLYVDSLTSDELVVRELGGGVSDVSFDYLVMGLRIGFEQAAVVQAKDREAPIPSAGMGAEYYTRPVDPGVHTPLERFRQMEADVRGVAVDEIDLSGAMALRESITASAWQRIGMSSEGGRPVADGENVSGPGRRDEAVRPGKRDATRGRAELTRPAFIAQDASEVSPDDTPDSQSQCPLFPVAEPVETGDLLALDPEHPGVLVRATTAQDPGVVGIVKGKAEVIEGELRVALNTDFALLKVDAGYGEIRPGDLLTSSFTPGHAMRAIEVHPGTIVGKALEPLDTGTGSIRVLVMPR